jgi:hypothetical protein
MQHYCIGSPDALLAKVIHQFLYRVHSKLPSRPNSHEDQAFSWLEKAYEERFNRLAYLKVEALGTLFAPIPGSPTCFDASASRLKLV